MRYKIGLENQIEHGCCYDCVVVDTTKPKIIGGTHYKGEYEVVCECFNEETGNKIVDALNSVNYKEVLKAYMQHVYDYDGSTFINRLDYTSLGDKTDVRKILEDMNKEINKD